MTQPEQKQFTSSARDFVDTWQASSSRDWTFGPSVIAGHSGGIGQYRAAYAIDLKAGTLLNGRVNAELRLVDQVSTGAGLICRADEHWTMLAFYVTRQNGADSTVARIGIFHEGVLTQVDAMREQIQLARGYNSFSLEFFSGLVRGQIISGDRKYELDAVCPHIPFAGHVGLVKFYGANILVRNFLAHPTKMPPLAGASNREDETHDFDVFLCHSSRDVEKVLEVANAFKQRGVSYWLDSEQITFGDPITRKIEDGLQRSRYIVPCVSENLTSASSWTRAEFGAILNAELSGNTERVVIPLTLDDSDVRYLPLLLKDKRRVSYSNSVEFDQFVKFLLR